MSFDYETLRFWGREQSWGESERRAGPSPGTYTGASEKLPLILERQIDTSLSQQHTSEVRDFDAGFEAARLRIEGRILTPFHLTENSVVGGPSALGSVTQFIELRVFDLFPRRLEMCRRRPINRFPSL